MWSCTGLRTGQRSDTEPETARVCVCLCMKCVVFCCEGAPPWDWTEALTPAASPSKSASCFQTCRLAANWLSVPSGEFQNMDLWRDKFFCYFQANGLWWCENTAEGGNSLSVSPARTARQPLSKARKSDCHLIAAAAAAFPIMHQCSEVYKRQKYQSLFLWSSFMSSPVVFLFLIQYTCAVFKKNRTLYSSYGFLPFVFIK